MQSQTSDQLRAWFRDVEPVCAELFNAAHAMCGNYDLAEYALRCAILDVWLQNASGGMGFRERLRNALRREAFDAALSDEGLAAEFTWPGLPPAREGDALAAQLGRERVEIQRLALLRYGCGLSPRAVGQLTGLSQNQARAELSRLEARCRRTLTGQDRSRTEALIAQRMKKALSRHGPGVPHPAQVYRAFEAEAVGSAAPGHRVTRAVGAVLAALLALLCAGGFWLFAILVQPAQF